MTRDPDKSKRDFEELKANDPNYYTRDISRFKEGAGKGKKINKKYIRKLKTYN